ncbi:hypothetical protein [Flavobacterium sp.]|uniref:hypothetical protein n=1 Tax=Flavobacterium sp. TaxID=239 RepID=UPI0028BDFA25|nr:hypothetical protein [Flavobacterium sp.]
MQKIIFYVAVTLCLFVSKLTAQETFEQRAKIIAQNIETITKEEKQALKDKVDAINVELDNKTISQEQADQQKIDAANLHSKNIEDRVALEQAKLNDLVQEKVEGKIQETSKDTLKKGRYSIMFGTSGVRVKDREKEQEERRTTSQFVFAAGVNNLVTDGAVAHSDYRYWGSHFYEWGISWNTRLAKNHNLLHAKYGLSLMYNNLRPTDNRYFVENGDQTDLVTSGINLKDSRFRNVNLVFPVHLEFDFSPKKTSKDGTKTYFRTHESFRFGIGGFAGFNIKSKQILKYDDNGHDYTVKEKGNFNTNDFVYGVSSYIGWGQTSLYVKYDLNPLFKNNAIDQNNISLGIRFDLN